MPPGENGRYLVCPVCRGLTFQTIRRQQRLLMYTCRTKEDKSNGCGTTFRRYAAA